LLSSVEVVDVLDYKPLRQSLQDCLVTAKTHRPELRISELKALQAGKMVRAGQSEFFPSVNLVGTYGRQGDTASVSGTEYKDRENWQIMAVANWNFWEWGKTKFRVDAVRAAENQAIDQSKELNDQIALEIRNAYLLLQEAESQIAVSQKVIDQAEENFRISEARYKERVARSTEVLDAQTLLTKAKSEYANALADYNISYARLLRAMGVTN
jgi:outer membrane protein TolC